MFKHVARLILPLVLLAMIALYLVLSPILSTKAAAPLVPVQHYSSSATYYTPIHRGPKPGMFWRP